MAKKWQVGYGTFEYEGPEGSRIERYFRPGRAPSTVREGGVTYRRCWDSFPSGSSVREDVHFTAYSLPPYEPGAPRYDEMGRAQFASRKEVDSFVEESKRAAERGESANAGGWEYVRDH